jgi:hypothetical protein
MYLRTLLNYNKNPKKSNQQLSAHFFRPYSTPSAFVRGIFYPIDALFEDTIPSLILTTYLIGEAIFHAFSSLGSLLLLQGKEASCEGKNSVNSLFLATATFALAMLAPILEAARFFTRWGATVAQNLPKPAPESKNTSEENNAMSMRA